jgi:hypothetical protein
VPAVPDDAPEQTDSPAAAETAETAEKDQPEDRAEPAEPVRELSFEPPAIPEQAGQWQQGPSEEFQAKAQQDPEEIEPLMVEIPAGAEPAPNNEAISPEPQESEPLAAKPAPLPQPNQRVVEEASGSVDETTFWKDLQELMPSQEIWQKLHDLEVKYGRFVPAAEDAKLTPVDQTVRLEVEEIDELESFEAEEYDTSLEPEDSGQVTP